MKLHIAILASTIALTSAMQAALIKRYPDATFTPIKKLSERPAGSIVASLGLPSFVPGQDGIKVLSFGSRILDNATTEERAHQWQVLRSTEASAEDVLAELGNWSEYTILQGRQIQDLKSTVTDIQVALMEAEDDTQKLALYKEGFNLLKGALA